MISPQDTWAIWTVLFGAAAFGMQANRYKIGAALSGPVCAMLFTAVLANVGVLPPPGPHISSIQGSVVKLATPLLLFNANLRQIFRDTGELMQAFLIGTFATVFGAFVAYLVMSVPLAAIGAGDGEGWKMVSALIAKNVGGGMNYIAVSSTLGVTPVMVAAGITVDNVFALLYFPLVSWLGDLRQPSSAHDEGDEAAGGGLDNKDISGERVATSTSGMPAPEPHASPGGAEFALALALASALVALSEIVAPSASIPMSTALAVLVATALPSQVGQLAPAGDLLGTLLLFVFFATAGASGGSVSAILSYSSLFGFLAIMYVCHLAVVLGAWKLLRLDLAKVLVASNANIGGPATASALAVSKGWTKLVIPGLLVGNFGNTIGTFIGLLLSQLLEAVS
ncbi:hypothetical protein CYMTET_4967 [Cymbomonas tetramitiformis]|uniref:Uncharacterized protein n=1 Tax=Cymbomonas tetramitiformis TaxID=36881 RepID=A0AAE0LJD1_9CHLO|nr:hypothetical protein CYMTET_4967 [Cymbomonas tetramitiformis]